VIMEMDSKMECNLEICNFHGFDAIVSRKIVDTIAIIDGYIMGMEYRKCSGNIKVTVHFAKSAFYTILFTDSGIAIPRHVWQNEGI